jgi:hypothetical protein
MGEVRQLFREASFDQQEIELLSQAYEMARKSLQNSGQPPIVQEIIAERIIAAAKRGELDPQRLCESALNGLGSELYP